MRVTITALADEVYAPLNGQGDCTDAVGAELPPGGRYTCSFVGEYSGSPGDRQIDTIKASAADEAGTKVTDDDELTVTIAERRLRRDPRSIPTRPRVDRLGPRTRAAPRRTVAPRRPARGNHPPGRRPIRRHHRTTLVPYELPRRWAAAFRAHGFDGIRHQLRHDQRRPSGVALFGGAGASTLDDGVRTALTTTATEAAGVNVYAPLTASVATIVT